jgi:hypothetical protein
MVEGMRSDLMTFSDHAFDKVKPLLGSVNLPLAVVVPTEEECDFGVVFRKEVKKVAGVVARAIIEG